MVLEKRNLKKLNHISVCRICILCLISSYFNNKYIYIFSLIFILFYSIKEALIYLCLIGLILFSNQINNDFIHYGIVERKINNYYVVDKLLYKTKIKDDNKFYIGDIVKTSDFTKLDNTYLKKNILYENQKYELIGKFSIRKAIYDRINSLNEDAHNGLNKFIYNINNYDDLSFNLGYGLTVYYIIKFLEKKNRHLSLIFVLDYSIFFYFDIKFYIFIIDYILSLITDNKTNVFWLKIIIILIINTCLLENYSVLLPLLMSLYGKVNLNISFRTYFALIESIIFGNINLINLLIYKYTIYIQIFLYTLSIIVLLIPGFSDSYSHLLKLYSFINNFEINIKGSISILCLLIFLIIKNKYKISHFLELVLVILLIISPINRPLLSVNYIDVGQGDACLISLPFKQGNILIDTGSTFNYYKLNQFLDKKGIYNIDYLIVTHDDSDHNGNIENLKRDYRVKQIVDVGRDIKLGKVKLKYLYIDDFENDNDNSLVYYTNINGIDFLFTGDISKNAERKLINKYGKLDIDVLKVSHHGSNTATSNYFLQNTIPRLAIISTSGQYGHPSNECLGNLNNFKVDIYNTKQDGNIEIYLFLLGNVLRTGNREFAIIKA